MTREPSDEVKAVLIMAEEALEMAIENCTFRWLFCWNGTEPADSCFDCACCIAWEKDSITCGCTCHKRIRELRALFRTALYSREDHNRSWFWDRGITGKQRIREVQEDEE